MANSEDYAEYFIDLSWYEKNNRSFSFVAQTRLCPLHQKKLGAKSGGPTPADFLKAIKGCCSKVEGFFSAHLPIKELILRLFLARGNQPLKLEEIIEGLSEWQNKASPQTLRHLLDNDHYYGLRRVSTSISPQSEESPSAAPTN